MTSPLKRILFVPDVHWPHADRAAWRLMLAAAKAIAPDIIAILGDFMDCYTLSVHDKHPNKRIRLHDEVAAASAALDQLDALGAARKIYACGNHENRLERYLRRQAPDLFDCVSIPDLLELKRRKWEWVDYRRFGQIGKVYVTHDVNGRAGTTALRNAQAAFGASVICGHTHRIEYRVVTEMSGASHVAASFGWLGSATAYEDYLHQAAARDWHHGFGIGYLETRTGRVHVTPVPIVRGAVVIDGKLIRAK